MTMTRRPGPDRRSVLAGNVGIDGNVGRLAFAAHVGNKFRIDDVPGLAVDHHDKFRRVQIRDRLARPSTTETSTSSSSTLDLKTGFWLDCAARPARPARPAMQEAAIAVDKPRLARIWRSPCEKRIALQHPHRHGHGAENTDLEGMIKQPLFPAGGSTRFPLIRRRLTQADEGSTTLSELCPSSSCC